MRKICEVEDCDDLTTSPGTRWCWKHYTRVRRHGDPTVVKRRGNYGHTSVGQFGREQRDAVEAKARYMRRIYGLTTEAFAWLLYDQNFRCAICFARLLADRNTHVDHDHENDRVRSLLCQSCNPMLGFAQDDAGLLRQAANYLDFHAKAKVAAHEAAQAEPQQQQ